MASMEETVVAILDPVFPGRFFYVEPDENIDAAAGPYAVFNVVGGSDPGNTLTQFSGYSTARLQIAILSEDAMDIPAGVKAVRQAMAAAATAGTLKSIPLGPGYDFPNDETLLLGRIVEYEIVSFDPLA